MAQPRALHGISATARHLLHRVGPIADPPRNLDNPRHARFQFPEPRPIVSKLVLHGLRPKAAERLSQVYMKNTASLRTEYERSMELATRAYIEHSPGPYPSVQVDIIQRTYLTQYHEALERYADLVLTASLQHAQISTSSSQEFIQEKTSVIRQNALSALETAFIQNAYPSRSQKLLLAQQTDMEYKQVHIWFQNKRTRSKKKGKRSPKFIPDERLRSLSPLSDMTCFICRDDQSLLTSVTATADLKHGRSAIDPFHIEAAPHGFPGPYPPICDYDPFPVTYINRRFMTEWPARPVSSHSHHVKMVNMDVLISTLEGLTVVDPNDQSKDRFPSSNSTSSGCPRHEMACFPFFTPLPVAPLPALLRREATTRSPHCHFPSQHFTYKSSPRTSSPSTPHTQGIKLTPTLPCRVPKSSSLLLRQLSHPYPSLRTRRHWRKTPLSSSASLSSISSDDSSVSSTPSSTESLLLTPPQHTIDLAYPAKSSTPTFVLSLGLNFGRPFNTSSSNSGPHDSFDTLSC